MDLLNKDIMDCLDESTAIKIAGSIVELIETEGNNNNLYCQYNISGGKLKSAKNNTWFVCDTNPGSFLDDFKKLCFVRNLNDEETGKLNDFFKSILNLIQSDYSSRIRDCIFRIIIPSVNRKKMPLNRIVANSLDIVDFSSFKEHEKYLWKIHRKLDDEGNEVSAISNQLIEDKDRNKTDSVIKYFFELCEKLEDKNLTYNEIFEIHKFDPEFKGVAGIVRGEKYLHDISLSLFIDYSLSDEFLEALNSNNYEKVLSFE